MAIGLVQDLRLQLLEGMELPTVERPKKLLCGHRGHRPSPIAMASLSRTSSGPSVLVAAANA